MFTTPIFYPNARPSLGTVYPVIAADVSARHARAKQIPTRLLTGTDEHGKKVEEAARTQTPPAAWAADPMAATKAYVDGRAAEFQAAFAALDVDVSRFIRTTDADHERIVRHVLQICRDRGDIYLGMYAGFYCVDCEAYYTPGELLDGGCCPDHRRPVITMQEPSYFFRLSRYGDRLLEFYDRSPEFILPENRAEEIRNFVRSGLQDLSISRTSCRWGIAIPWDPAHVTYVWFDALLNYVTGAGYLSDPPADFAARWSKTTHIVGKDILRFHAVTWVAMLLSAGLTPPARVFAHGFWMVNGRKFSKSLGNAIDPEHLVRRYGVDPLRYYLMRVPPFGADGNFSEEELVQRSNSELAHGIGNMATRTVAMISRYCGGRIPGPPPADHPIARLAASTVRAVDLNVTALRYHAALEAIGDLTAALNRFVNEAAPWQLDRAHRTAERDAVLAILAESLRVLGGLIHPFMPASAGRLAAMIGTTVPAYAALDWGTAPLTGGAVAPQSAPLFPVLEPPVRAKPVIPTVSAEEAILALGYHYQIAQLTGVIVRRRHATVETEKRRIEEHLRGIGREGFLQSAAVTAFHDIYRRLGKPRHTIPSPMEGLASHIFSSGFGRLPTISTIVDLYNVYSLRYGLSIGAHDRQKLTGPIAVRMAREPLRFQPLGTAGTMTVEPGEYYWTDDRNVLCRLDLKQGEATKVDDSTEDVVLIVAGAVHVSSDALRDLTAQLCRDLTSVCGGVFELRD